MIRCLHECRCKKSIIVIFTHCRKFIYFCGVAASPKQQRTLIEGFFNDCFKVRNISQHGS